MRYLPPIPACEKELFSLTITGWLVFVYLLTLNKVRFYSSYEPVVSTNAYLLCIQLSMSALELNE